MITRKRPDKDLDLRFGTWNIKTLNGKEEEIVDEMEKYRLNILGLSEVKRKGRGEKTLKKNYKLYYSGVTEGRAKKGVGFIIKEDLENRIEHWEAVTPRITYITLLLEEKLTIIQIYAPTTSEDILELEQFYNKLQETINRTREKGHKMIIMGDWNSRIGNKQSKGNGTMGQHGGELTRNENGKRMIEFCLLNNILIGNTFFPHKQVHKITFEAEGTGSQTITDYVTYTSETRYNILDVRVFRGAELATDHFLLVVKYRCKIYHKKNKSKPFTKLKVRSLEDPEKRKEYEERITKKLQTINQENTTIDQKWEIFKTAILESAEEVCGRVKIGQRKKRTPWWNETVRQVVKEKKQAWKKYQKSKTEQNRQEYIQKRNLSRDTLKVEKQKSWEEFGKEIENKFKSNKKEFWGIVKGIRKGERKLIRNIKNDKGELKTEEAEILNTWADHFSNKFKLESTLETVNTQTHENQEENEENNITLAEVKAAVKNIKNQKAEGADQIAPEFIKYGGEKAIETLWKLLMQVWDEEKIPEEWKQNIIVPIYKKGSSTDCNNYRAICLASVILKIYTRIIEKRIRSITEKHMQEEQAAFRALRQTQDHIFTLRTTIEKMLEYQRDIFVAFLDLTAAFDNIDRNQIWKVLEEKKVPLKLRKVTESVYKEVYGRVRIKGNLSKTFIMDKGLKQGDSLSPLLFILLMDKVAKECNNKNRKFRTKLGHWNLIPTHIQSLIFADDIVLIADSPDKLQQILKNWEEKLKEMNMIINPNKSKILHVTKNKEQNLDLNITIQEEKLEVVEQYKYLGTMFSKSGKISEEIKNRVKSATNIYYSINRTIIGKKEITAKTKLQVYNAIYKPTLLYGSESWPVNGKIEQQITACEMKYLRRVANKTKRDHERNSKIREELDLKPLTSELETRQLKWYGHVKRMDKKRLPRKVWETRMEGRRSRGRPRTTWLQSVTNAGRRRNKNFGDMNRVTADREEWKRFAESDPTP